MLSLTLEVPPFVRQSQELVDVSPSASCKREYFEGAVSSSSRLEVAYYNVHSKRTSLRQSYPCEDLSRIEDPRQVDSDLRRRLVFSHCFVAVHSRIRSGVGQDGDRMGLESKKTPVLRLYEGMT